MTKKIGTRDARVKEVVKHKRVSTPPPKRKRSSSAQSDSSDTSDSGSESSDSSSSSGSSKSGVKTPAKASLRRRKFTFGYNIILGVILN